MKRLFACRRLWPVLGASAIAGALLLPSALRAESTSNVEQEVAYCDTDEFAIKIFSFSRADVDTSEPRETLIRIYDRADDISFINRVPVTQAPATEDGIVGTIYENLRGENQWRLFVADTPGMGFDPESPSADPGAGVHQCFLARDGEVISYGVGRIATLSVGGDAGSEPAGGSR